ncbi:MAG: ABC transporter permease [Proteobacteria bacterium]|nr:ABC transporter permease [Pseudomonadota bacterium]
MLRPLADVAEQVGRATARGLADLGFAGALFAESLYWTLMGRRRRQPVRVGSVFVQMMEIGILALPIVTVLSLTIGVMLAIQGIYTLRIFGAEDRVTLGIALSVTREFAPLITGILVTGRSGSAIAARLGTMTINQEIDALTTMAVNPVRFLVAPALLAMVVMLPVLTFYADLVAILGGGLYVAIELGMSLAAYTDACIDSITTDDLFHGLGKSLIFAVLITLVGAVNGASVRGGAEGVGRATTRSVVHGISAIVITDMIFAFVVSR